MNKFALVKQGVVQTVIETNSTKDAFPDIANSLVDCTSEVKSNWIYDGVNFTAPVAPIVDITPRQIRLALEKSGISLSSVDTALDSLPEPIRTFAKIEWEHSVIFDRTVPLVTQMGAMLGITPEQIDNLWRLAATL